MSNDIDTQAIQKTQKILGKFLKKPPLTEKLLRKPPFRFLHDVVSNVVRETNFLKGLYTERELVSENVKDKDEKIAFLNKLIEATKAVTGKELNVKSTKVIAGLEPAETNLLLQTIGMAIDKKLDSSSYIAGLKSGQTIKSQVPTQGTDKKTKPVKVKEKSVNKDEKKKNTSIPTPKNNISKTSDKPKGGKILSSKDTIESNRKEVKGKGVIKKVKDKTATPKEKSVISTPQQNNVIETEIKTESNNPEEINIVNEIDENKESKLEKIEDTVNVSEENDDIKTLQNVLEQEEFDSSQDTKSKVVVDSEIEEKNIKPISVENDMSSYLSEKAPISGRVKSAKPKDSILKSNSEEALEPNKELVPHRLKSGKQRTNNTILDNDSSTHLIPTQLENNSEKPLARPRSSLRPPSVRPSSARPGAPRLRNDIALLEGEVIPMGKVNVIVETFSNKEEDEEETVTMQTTSELEYQAPVLQLPTDKGHLVEQILEQIQQDEIIEHTKPAVIEWEQDGFRNRIIANKENEQLKAAIQTLTRTANPLGKLVNYLHEDIEAMHNELDVWINSARQIMVDVVNQKRINNESNKPLQTQLEEIEDNIVKHQQQIVIVHGNILRNEQRIRDLLIK